MFLIGLGTFRPSGFVVCDAIDIFHEEVGELLHVVGLREPTGKAGNDDVVADGPIARRSGRGSSSPCRHNSLFKLLLILQDLNKKKKIQR